MGTASYINGPGHMTKVVAMAIKNTFITRTSRPMILKHQAMKLYKVCINHDPGMTLTYFYFKVKHRSPMHLNGEN